MSEYSFECLDAQISAKSYIRKQRQENATQAADNLKQLLSPAGKKALELAGERRASNWLTSLSIQDFGVSLHKGAFVDALSLRYGWPPTGTPTHCMCGTSFSVQHAPRGGFRSIRHKKIRDVTANLLTKVCHKVMVEPNLKLVSWEALSYTTSNRPVACKGRAI